MVPVDPGFRLGEDRELHFEQQPGDAHEASPVEAVGCECSEAKDAEGKKQQPALRVGAGGSFAGRTVPDARMVEEAAGFVRLGEGAGGDQTGGKGLRIGHTEAWPRAKEARRIQVVRMEGHKGDGDVEVPP